ncbi:MAG: hypothetical protein V8R55_10790 [Dysosmobacter sp.]
MIILVIVLVPATVLAAAWFWLLGQVSREDWVTAAYNRVLDGRLEEERLRRKDARREETLARYHGMAAKVMGLVLGGDSQKKIEKLRQEGEALRSGDLGSVSLFEMPGYVLQRRYKALGRGSLHKTLLERNTELYGKKYAVNKTKQLLARLLSYPIWVRPRPWPWVR